MKRSAHKGPRDNIKYCGNCNPDLHPKYVRTIVDTIFKDTEPDTLVLINGCARECLTKSKAIQSVQKIISVNAREIVEKDGASNNRRNNGL